MLRRLGTCLPALVVLCLPAILSAQSDPFQDPHSRIYRFHSAKLKSVPHPIPASATRVGDWEVTVAFDIVRCEISCAYRQKQDTFGRVRLGSLLAPVIEIRIDTGFGSRPETVLLDPAGLLLPTATRSVRFTPDQLCIPARKISNATLQPAGAAALSAALQPQSNHVTNYASTSILTIIPLRI